MLKAKKCKNCTGELAFNPKQSMLVCERCGSSFAVSEKKDGKIRRLYDVSYSPVENQKNQIVYKCSTCNSKIIAGTGNEIHRCSSCGNTTLIKETSVMNLPDAIIPFKIERNKAAEIFRKWVKKRKLAPNDLVQMAKLEKISGIYTPVWNFNYKYYYQYSATGLKKKLDSYDNEVINKYVIQKVLEDSVDNQLFSASTRIPDEKIDMLGEYNFGEVRPYSTDYLMGFTGIDTNRDVHKIYKGIVDDINKDCSNKIKNKLEDEYDYVEDFSCKTKLKDVSFTYAHVPVWANHYTYKGKTYHCYINGQTGFATGNSPKSVGKIMGIIIGVLTGIGATLLIISKLI